MRTAPALGPKSPVTPRARRSRRDDLPRCATCAHARVIPDVRPIEWRCRGGRPAGGLVYRSATSGAFSQYLTTPRKCPGYVRMG